MNLLRGQSQTILWKAAAHSSVDELLTKANDSRVDDAIKHHVQKMDWLLMEAGVGVGKVAVLLPKEMTAEITAWNVASSGQTEDIT